MLGNFLLLRKNRPPHLQGGAWAPSKHMAYRDRLPCIRVLKFKHFPWVIPQDPVQKGGKGRE